MFSPLGWKKISPDQFPPQGDSHKHNTSGMQEGNENMNSIGLCINPGGSLWLLRVLA